MGQVQIGRIDIGFIEIYVAVDMIWMTVCIDDCDGFIRKIPYRLSQVRQSVHRIDDAGARISDYQISCRLVSFIQKIYPRTDFFYV